MARVRSRLVRLNLDAIDPDAPGAGRRRRIRLNLFPGLAPEIEETLSGRNGGSGFHWFGRPTNDQAADVVLSVEEGRVSGSVALRQGYFQIRHLEDDLHEIAEVSYDRSQPAGDTLVPPLTLPKAEPKAAAATAPVEAAGDPVIDILVVYTPGARQKAGGSQAIQDRIALAIAEANASFVNSAAAIQFQLVGKAEMDLTGTPAPTGSFLDQMTSYEPSLQSLRNYYGADMVSVWVENTAGSVVGIAWLNPGPPYNFASHAYGIVTLDYANGPFYAFAHEGGHNLGGAHDRAHASSAGAFSYSYGYRYDPNPGGGFFTIMAYSSGCGGCVASNRWSNPNLLYDGVPSGVPQGQSDSADNAATLTQIAPSASAFRAQQSPPANNPPTATDQSLSVTSSVAAPITLTGTDPNGHTVFFDVLTQPLHGDLEGSGSSWTYTGDVGYAGPDSFQFQARDHLGGFDVGTVSLNVQLPSTIPPNVTLAAPAGGPFTSPATVNLVAMATDSDGSVDHVDFFANSTLIGTATSATSTFSFAWTNVLEGEYQVTAVAHDNLGVTKTSNAVSVSVGAGSGGAGYTTRLARLFYAFDEGAGSTVFDHVGAHNGSVGGSATWAAPGLKGGYVDSGVSTFAGNELSAVSGDAFTLIWVGRLGAASAYQTLFSMGETSADNAWLRYYQPNGYLYLTLNKNSANYYNAGSLLNKNVMITLRCAAGACSWRVGGSGAWMSANVGTTEAANPLLQVGVDPRRWYPSIANTAALFWVYGDALTDPEIAANFQYAGSALAGRGHTLDGYVGSSNSNPTANDQTLSTPYQTPLGITLTATDPDPDTLTFATLAGPSHGSLSGIAPSLTYTPANGYSGPDSFTFQVSDGHGGSDTGLVSINVGAAPNTPPNVSLAQPSGGPFTAPANITLVATATDPGGSVAQVQMFANGSSIGTATPGASNTFSFHWTGVAAGSYTVFARAVDNLGAPKDSTSITVQVGASGGGPGAGFTTRQALLYYAFDEGAGSTVLDHVGTNDGAVGGAASWVPPGLKGGFVDSGATSFGANKLSAAAGNAFTILWVGRLAAANAYQTVFSMGDTSADNVLLRFYQPNGYLYLTLNKNAANYFNAGSMLNKNVMIALRCAGGACSWRVGGSGVWMNGSVGSTSAAAPLLQVGADPRGWYKSIANTAALFWVYGDSLTDSEVNANFQYAGATLAGRGHTLDGYTAPVNSAPSVSLAQPAGGPFTAPASINLVATATDTDGSIDHVELFANGGSIGTATPGASNTFSFNWTGVSAGTHTVFARAFDNLGASKDSTLISVQVGSSGGNSGSGYTTRQGLLYYSFDEGAGSTVLDHAGAHNGTVGGSATWVAPGLKGGYVDSGVSSFAGNKLSAAAGNAFTMIWVGRLSAASAYQTIFSMGEGGTDNVLLRYYQPNGYLYLTLNKNSANYINPGSLVDKNVMIALRCAGGSCAWRVGGSGAWINGNVGTTSAANPLLQVGADPRRWYQSVANTSALFWVYGDALTDQEVASNFQFAGAALASRGHALDGYVPPSNSAPAAESATTTIGQDRYAFVYLKAVDPDGDPLTYQVISGPAHGTLQTTGFPFRLYQPQPGFTGTDQVQFQASDGHGGVSTGTVTIVVEPHHAFTTTISTTAELHQKLRFAQPGETVLLAPGVYSQPIFSTTDWGLRGTATHPIVFRALDPSNPPTIENGIQLQGSCWLRFEHLRVIKPAYHNVNVYPFGQFASHDIVFDGIYTESKPELTLAANFKITRSDNITVRNSTFYGWGDNAIDTIGLWGGLIEESVFLGRSGFTQRTGLQLKGDTRDVIVRNNYFHNGGQRVVQIGGGTGASFFREPPSFEAQRVEVAGNRIVGGSACFSLATQTGSRVHHNTCYLPTVWIARLLNENGTLEPNQNGQFDHNIFVYNSGINLEFVNLSADGNVDVDSFVFDNNAYFQADGDSPALPNLPVIETNMIDQIDPQIVDAGLATMRVGSANPVFSGVGADAVNPAL